MHSVEWAAGLFEGEGCIQVDKRRERAFYLTLRMCDKDVVYAFAEVFGVGNVTELHPPAHRKKGHSKFYSWTISRREHVRTILSAMLPYFGNRRAYKALNVLDALELKS